MSSKIRITKELLTDLLQLSDLGVNITNVYMKDEHIDLVLDKQVDDREYVSLCYTHLQPDPCSTAPTKNRMVEFK